jgi:chromosome segregation ATPase
MSNTLVSNAPHTADTAVAIWGKKVCDALNELQVKYEKLSKEVIYLKSENTALRHAIENAQVDCNTAQIRHDILETSLNTLQAEIIELRREEL